MSEKRGCKVGAIRCPRTVLALSMKCIPSYRVVSPVKTYRDTVAGFKTRMFGIIILSFAGKTTF